MGRKNVKDAPEFIRQILNAVHGDEPARRLLAQMVEIARRYPSSVGCLMFDQILRLRADELQRVLLCPGCARFVWRKKMDAETCGERDCVAVLNNARRRVKRSVSEGIDTDQ